MELRPQPGRFADATVTLTLIANLLMFLIGGLLDGLLQSATGAYRAHPASSSSYRTPRTTPSPAARNAATLRVQVEDAVGGAGVVAWIAS